MPSGTRRKSVSISFSRTPMVLKSSSFPLISTSSIERRRSKQLTSPVKFGWGLLGHLDKGGTFHVKQIGRAPSELQSRLHLVCRLLLEKKKARQPRTATAPGQERPSVSGAYKWRRLVFHAGTC